MGGAFTGFIAMWARCRKQKMVLDGFSSGWEGIDASTKSSPSLNIFKTRLNSGTKASPKYFHIGDRKENIIHCQMRNDASNLNLHLQQHHLSDRPSCPHCNDPCESPSHYFMHCPLYNIHRQQLVDSFNELNI
jgi:hypothetical protein